MSSNHDQDNHSNEAKPVAFRTPLILGLVTILIILLAVSTCDKKHDCCEDKEDCSEESMKNCNSDDHSEHHEGTEAHTNEHTTEAHEENAEVADTLVKEVATPVKAEEHEQH